MSRDEDFEVRPCDAPRARELGAALGVSATIGQVLLHRGIADVESARDFIEPRLSLLTDPRAMRDRDTAADRLAWAVRRGERIAVFGDYDVDGTTATAILSEILERLGADVVALVANRFDGGYGLSDPALDRVLATGARVLVTCDCGSADHARIERARRAGLDVIVVDHHLVPREPLPALAFLNPRRGDCPFAYKGLASAGLALSLAAAVRALLNPSLDPRELLDFVALGTVADVAPLDGDNRRLVRAGLARLAARDARPGILALREVAKAPGPVGGSDIAFRLAPRLNAAGRLEDASLALALLRARTLEEARALAARLEALNVERRAIQQANTVQAVADVRRIYGETVDGGIVVASSDWHRGVVGIVAARLAELFEAPAIVIAIEGSLGHGSGRTFGGFPLHTAVSRSASALHSFGGHEAALGLRIEPSAIERFRSDFDATCRALRADGFGPRARYVDVALDEETFPLPRASELAILEPVGAGNPEPSFLVENADVEDVRVVGSGHLKLVVRRGALRVHAFGYQMGEDVERLGERCSIVGWLRPDTFRGDEHVEMKLRGIRRR